MSTFGQPRRIALLVVVTVITAIALVNAGARGASAQEPSGPEIADGVAADVASNGTADVVVALRTGVPSTAFEEPSAERGRQAALGRAAQGFVDRLPRGAEAAADAARASRYVAVEVDAEGLEALRSDPTVESISLNEWRKPTLATSITTVGAPIAWQSGYTGGGNAVAILDTGVQANHPLLNGRVTNGACFSGAGDPTPEPGVTPLCPGGNITGSGVAAGAPCSTAIVPDSAHGTHVAGIAAGVNGPPDAPSGIAPGANIIAIQVFTRLSGTTGLCGPFPACVLTADVDVLAALEWVDAHRDTDNIVAANLSLGGSQGFSSDCDSQESLYSTQITTNRNHGVATVVASGNNGFVNQITAPACVSNAIAVGSVNTGDLEVSLFSNSSPSLDLLAPGARSFTCPGGNCSGEGIHSSVPGSGYDDFFGTSMAAPAVAGAWAVMRQAYSTTSDASTVGEIEGLLESTGRIIQDVQGAFPLIQLDEALPRPKGTYHPVAPARLLDTRFGTGAPQAKVGADKSIDLQVTGRGGVPSSGVSAVVLNVTYVLPSSFGFVTVWPKGALRPNASNLNLNPGDARPNLVTVRMGAGGKVSLYNAAGTVDLVADVAGWYDDEDTNNGGYYHATSPTRVLDTRIGTGAPAQKVGPGGKLTIDVTNVSPTLSPIPAGATAAVVNLVGTGATAGTHVTAYPANLPNPPNASNLNISQNQTRPNLAIVPLDANGNLTLYNNAGSIDLIADIQGWYDDTPGYRFVPKSPSRILDTRINVGKTGALGANQSFALQVTGRGNVPNSGVAGVVMNLTSTGVNVGGFVTVYPDGVTLPTVSNLNLEIGKDVPNLVASALPGNGRARIYNAVGNVHLIGDVAGWFTT